MVMPSRVHAVIDGEVAANQVGAHRGTFTSERFIDTDSVSLVFAIVDANNARIAAGIGERVVCWLGPVAAAAEAWVMVSLLFQTYYSSLFG